MRKQTSIATEATAQSENAALGKESANLDWFRYQLGVWASQNLRDFPWRRTSEPYAIFIAEFLPPARATRV